MKSNEIYQYKCGECGHISKRIQGMFINRLVIFCDKCGELARRVEDEQKTK